MIRMHVSGGSLGALIFLAVGGCDLFGSDHLNVAEDFVHGAQGAGANAGQGVMAGNGATAGSAFASGTGGSESPPGEVSPGDPWKVEGKHPIPSMCVAPDDATPYCTTRPNFAFSSAGVDVNADGYVDLVVGAPFTGEGNPGAVIVFAGSADGLALSPSQELAPPAGDRGFGVSVARAGDVNNDGFDDVIVGTVGDGKTPISEQPGRALLYLGSAAGLGPTPVWELEPTCQFGCAVAGAGDVNGDGFDDVIIGARSSDADLTKKRVFIYLGTSSGLQATPVFASGAEDAGANSEFGSAVAGAGDLDGDGYGDVVVGASQYGNKDYRGRAYVYRGMPSGVASEPWTTLTGEPFEQLGKSVASAGDVNGDGFDDLVTGGSELDDTGRVRLFLGAQSELSATTWTTGSYRGTQVGTRAGDVNGDGFDDVVVSYPVYAGPGTAAVFLGSPGGLGANLERWTVHSTEEHEQFGFDVLIAGDLNGDGYADVVVGAPYHDDSRGEITAYLSAPAGLQGN